MSQEKENSIPMNELALIWQLTGQYLAGNGGNLSYVVRRLLT